MPISAKMELFEMCPHPSDPIRSGFLSKLFKSRKSMSVGDPKAISADRRTLPETTHLPIRSMMSTISLDVRDEPHGF